MLIWFDLIWFDIDEINDILSTSGLTGVNKDEEIDQLEFDEENDENEVEDSNEKVLHWFRCKTIIV